MKSDAAVADEIRKYRRDTRDRFKMDGRNLVKRAILQNLGAYWDAVVAAEAWESGVTATAKLYGLERRTVKLVHEAGDTSPP